MSLFIKYWEERRHDVNSFTFNFSVPVTNLTWKDKVVEFDLEFLKKGEKFGLFYLMENILSDYERKRKSNYIEIIDNYVELLSLRNYFPNEFTSAYKFIGDFYINLPYIFDGRMICKPMKYHKPFLGLGILEFENYPGIDISQYNKDESWNGTLHFSIDSSSNIWWEEILYFENDDCKILNNRPWAYRITPRFNSFLRDIKLKTKELGGTILLEEYNRKYVVEDGILLDGNIIYQEDLDQGRLFLASIDKQPT
jgi:hypothetical protein